MSVALLESGRSYQGSVPNAEGAGQVPTGPIQIKKPTLETRHVDGVDLFIAWKMTVGEPPPLTPQRPRRTNDHKNGLAVPIGGGMDKTFGFAADLMKDGPVVLMNHPSGDPEMSKAFYEEVLIYHGVPREQIHHIGADTLPDHSINLLRYTEEREGSAFVTGGDQARATDAIERANLTPSLREIRRRGRIIGTSAGASIQGGNQPQGEERIRGTKLLEGEDAEDISVDQHAGERGRVDTRVVFAASELGILSLGLDEDTFVVVDPDGRIVHADGAGSVHFAQWEDGAVRMSSQKAERGVQLPSMRRKKQPNATPVLPKVSLTTMTPAAAARYTRYYNEQ